MNGLVGKGSSAIMTVSTSQSHTQKAMLRERRRRRKKRREYQKGSLVHILRAHPQLHQSAPGLCVWATKWSVSFIAPQQCLSLPRSRRRRSLMHTAQREAAERDRRASRRASSDLQQQTMKESQAEGKRRKGKENGDDDDTEALTTQDRRKRQKCLQLSASETATASSSSSQAVHPPEAPAAVGSGGDQHPQQRSCLSSVSVFILGRLGARSLQATSVPSCTSSAGQLAECQRSM